MVYKDDDRDAAAVPERNGHGHGRGSAYIEPPRADVVDADMEAVA